MTAAVDAPDPDLPSKTLATWVAIIGGSFGLHHFYLRGWRSPLGWLYPIPTLVGMAGVARMRTLGLDDRLGWMLVPWLGLTVSIGMLCAIVIGLTSDVKWARRYMGVPPQSDGADEDDDPPGLVRTGWGPVLGVVLALMIGAGVLMSTIAFVVEKLFTVHG